MPGTRKQLCEYRHQKNHEDCWGKVGAGFLRKSLFTCFLKEVFYCQIFLLGSDFQRHFTGSYLVPISALKSLPSFQVFYSNQIFRI